MMNRGLCWECLLFVLLLVRSAAAQHHGLVKFNGLPVPGATVTASRGDTRLAVITDEQGVYAFPGLPPGTWTLSIEMTGFAKAEREIAAGSGAAVVEWELKMLPLEAMNVQPRTSTQTSVQRTVTDAPGPNPDAATPAPAATSDAFRNLSPEQLQQRAADSFLISGSANNGAASPFSQSPAFGNNRRGPGSLYTGNLGVIVGNSALDARPFSLTGQNTPRPDYNRVQGVLSFGGPLRIPHLLRRNGPNLTLNYQWLRNHNVTAQSGMMPTAAERNGDLSRWSNAITDPATGLPFPGNAIPSNRISPQATALLSLYPLPNFTGDSRYNFQVPIAANTHEDNLQSRFTQRLPRRNQLSGNFAYSSTRSDSPNLFGFLDKAGSAGTNAGVNWLHMFGQRLYTVLGYQYSRFSTRTTPFFAHRLNVSGEARIGGNNQEPVNWGPPALAFSSGVAGLSDAQSSFTRNQTSGVSLDIGWIRGRHSLAFGGLFRRQQFNLLAQEDPRGTIAFTGAAAGSDLAGFLLGIPDASSIAFGNADKYLRASASAAYVTDDWRLSPGLTLNLGVRWEYGSPVSERYGRLVNLDIVPGFAAATPITGSSAELLHPDRNNVAPRFGFAWRPLAASSMVVRGGYGVYHDTSVYQAIATRMAQQSPFSTSLRAENSAATPLTLANPFAASAAITSNTFAVDPDFRIGYSQNWQLSVQRDLPASLAMIVTYLGSKGTRAQQQLLPNTFPAGAVNQCPACPAGFIFLTSNGNSIRHAGQVELRRRLRSGISASVQYTFAKSIDDAALGGQNQGGQNRGGQDQGGRSQGGALIAQNWLDLRSERALSNFDQRHLVSVQAQYTTGMGLGGGTLAGGWKGGLFKDWTFSSQITAGTGLPLTPIYFAAVKGAGVTGTIRPDYTGAPLYDAPAGLFLNTAAYAAPAPGRWGSAGRNSITGPSQFTLNASLSRTFAAGDRLSLDFRLEALNALNHPVFPSWNTVVTSAQFGLPNPANPMRSVQTVVRLRF